ncbi:hypothetical protein EVAR_33966_1 [Eumeta japonica]|uniref:Uncharacterized protein n=1 Tax=Eumeta variegata TaxID=151549 RepID=A0A4C1X1G1_EUMVA|nr:hypothetical protein EVAR_33966_1 [Eumeta japonica]
MHVKYERCAQYKPAHAQQTEVRFIGGRANAGAAFSRRDYSSAITWAMDFKVRPRRRSGAGGALMAIVMTTKSRTVGLTRSPEQTESILFYLIRISQNSLTHSRVVQGLCHSFLRESGFGSGAF